MIALLVSAFAATTPALSTRPPVPPQPAWQAPAPTKTGNVVVLPQHQLPMVHILVSIPAGSALDPANRPGLAAAVAGMLQDGGAGTRSAPEVAQAFADLGTELEEHVDTDQVQLQVTVLARNLDRAIALVRDLVEHPRFDGADWQRAQARRIDEIHRRLDEPEHLADDLFARVLYGDHPYGHPFLGTVDSVRAITVDDLRGFWSRYYGCGNVTYILVGDTDPSVRQRFPACTDIRAPWPAPPPAPKASPARVVVFDRPGAPQSQIRVGHLGAARATPDFAALSLLETVLGGSFTSRLNLNLREKHGYTYGARANFELRTVAGPFVATAGVRTDVTAAALKETVAEIAGMRAPLSADELHKGRNLVLHTIVEAFADGNETTAYLADLVAHRLPIDSWSKLPAELGALDLAATTRAAARHFRPDELTIVIVGDRKLIEPELRLLPFVKSIEFLTP
jgi:zinc protease